MTVTVKEFIKEKGFDIKNVALYGVDADGNHNDFEKSYIDCDAVYDDLEVHDYIINDEDVIIFIKTDDIYAVVCITGNLNFQKVTRDNFFEKFSEQDRGYIYIYDRFNNLEEAENKFETYQSHAEKISGTLTLEYTLYALAKWSTEDELWEEIKYADWDEATSFR